MNISSIYTPHYMLDMDERKRRVDMEKEKRIKEFKESTPAGILKQFKSDDDIWDYLNNQGEWEGSVKTIKNINLTAKSKEEAEKIIRETILSTFTGGK